MPKDYCPDCDNKAPEFKTHFLYNVYIRQQRHSSTLRYKKIAKYCLNCEKFFVFDQITKTFILSQ